MEEPLAPDRRQVRLTACVSGWMPGDVLPVLDDAPAPEINVAPGSVQVPARDGGMNPWIDPGSFVVLNADELPTIATTCTNCHEEVRITFVAPLSPEEVTMAETVLDTAASLLAGLTTYANSVFEQLATLSGNLEALREHRELSLLGDAPAEVWKPGDRFMIAERGQFVIDGRWAVSRDQVYEVVNVEGSRLGFLDDNGEEMGIGCQYVRRVTVSPDEGVLLPEHRRLTPPSWYAESPAEVLEHEHRIPAGTLIADAIQHLLDTVGPAGATERSITPGHQDNCPGGECFCIVKPAPAGQLVAVPSEPLPSLRLPNIDIVLPDWYPEKIEVTIDNGVLVLDLGRAVLRSYDALHWVGIFNRLMARLNAGMGGHPGLEKALAGAERGERIPVEPQVLGHVTEDDDELVELTGADLPYHLQRDAPDIARCSGCERGAHRLDDIGRACGMTQPSGERCAGRFEAIKTGAMAVVMVDGSRRLPGWYTLPMIRYEGHDTVMTVGDRTFTGPLAGMLMRLHNQVAGLANRDQPVPAELESEQQHIFDLYDALQKTT